MPSRLAAHRRRTTAEERRTWRGNDDITSETPPSLEHNFSHNRRGEKREREQGDDALLSESIGSEGKRVRCIHIQSDGEEDVGQDRGKKTAENKKGKQQQRETCTSVPGRSNDMDQWNEDDLEDLSNIHPEEPAKEHLVQEGIGQVIEPNHYGNFENSNKRKRDSSEHILIIDNKNNTIVTNSSAAIHPTKEGEVEIIPSSSDDERVRGMHENFKDFLLKKACARIDFLEGRKKRKRGSVGESRNMHEKEEEDENTLKANSIKATTIETTSTASPTATMASPTTSTASPTPTMTTTTTTMKTECSSPSSSAKRLRRNFDKRTDSVELVLDDSEVEEDKAEKVYISSTSTTTDTSSCLEDVYSYLLVSIINRIFLLHGFPFSTILATTTSAASHFSDLPLALRDLFPPFSYNPSLIPLHLRLAAAAHILTDSTLSSEEALEVAGIQLERIIRKFSENRKSLRKKTLNSFTSNSSDTKLDNNKLWMQTTKLFAHLKEINETCGNSEKHLDIIPSQLVYGWAIPDATVRTTPSNDSSLDNYENRIDLFVETAVNLLKELVRSSKIVLRTQLFWVAHINVCKSSKNTHPTLSDIFYNFSGISKKSPIEHYGGVFDLLNLPPTGRVIWEQRRDCIEVLQQSMKEWKLAEEETSRKKAEDEAAEELRNREHEEMVFRRTHTQRHYLDYIQQFEHKCMQNNSTSICKTKSGECSIIENIDKCNETIVDIIKNINVQPFLVLGVAPNKLPVDKAKALKQINIGRKKLAAFLHPDKFSTTKNNVLNVNDIEINRIFTVINKCCGLCTILIENNYHHRMIAPASPSPFADLFGQTASPIPPAPLPPPRVPPTSLSSSPFYPPASSASTLFSCSTPVLCTIARSPTTGMEAPIISVLSPATSSTTPRVEIVIPPSVTGPGILNVFVLRPTESCSDLPPTNFPPPDCLVSGYTHILFGKLTGGGRKLGNNDEDGEEFSDVETRSDLKNSEKKQIKEYQRKYRKERQKFLNSLSKKNKFDLYLDLSLFQPTSKSNVSENWYVTHGPPQKLWYCVGFQYIDWKGGQSGAGGGDASKISWKKWLAAELPDCHTPPESIKTFERAPFLTPEDNIKLKTILLHAKEIQKKTDGGFYPKNILKFEADCIRKGNEWARKKRYLNDSYIVVD